MKARKADANDREMQKARLREALRRDEFELYLQPIGALRRAGDVRLAEVLIRLRQEEKALLPPGDFLPAFELFGMLPLLDSWVLGKVAQCVPRSDLRFSINVSGQTLELDELPRLLAELAVPLGRLLFEVEESDLVRHAKAAPRFCAAIRELGAALVVDGFGRRELSFAAFAHLQPELVKIDGSLTRTLCRDDSAVARLQAVRRLADSLGAGLVAECVESEEVRLKLDALGVDHAQGYGICAPRPLEALLALEPQLAAA